MEKRKPITVEEVKELAQEYYDKGGDAIVECYEDEQIAEEIAKGRATKLSWIRLFHFYNSMECERF